MAFIQYSALHCIDSVVYRRGRSRWSTNSSPPLKDIIFYYYLLEDGLSFRYVPPIGSGLVLFMYCWCHTFLYGSVCTGGDNHRYPLYFSFLMRLPHHRSRLLPPFMFVCLFTILGRISANRLFQLVSEVLFPTQIALSTSLVILPV